MKRRQRAPTKRRGSRLQAVKKILVCPDAHHPYVDELAWSTFLEVAKHVKPDALVIIGDFADCYSVSQYSKSPERRVSLKSEIDSVNRALDQLERLGIPEVIYVEGNHEDRLTRYMCERAPELYGLVSAKELLRVKARGWRWVPYRDWFRIGKLAFTHDVGRAGVNATRQSLLDFGGNLVYGHTHRGGVVYQGTVEGDQHVCLNVGWLGDYESIDYMHRARARREWQHGAGLCYQTEDGYSWVSFLPILDGRCVAEGKVVTGRRPDRRKAA